MEIQKPIQPFHPSIRTPVQQDKSVIKSMSDRKVEPQKFKNVLKKLRIKKLKIGLQMFNILIKSLTSTLMVY
ncbi:hypothetical protein ACFRAE_00105 [Sphingobacterium sp. HJSM2_6]|uniref:hypothetical protein n=1 Tax=Sphingobacterium sp. HJSM2_6 TaxID=3366264 RepID=UPI003BBB77FD